MNSNKLITYSIMFKVIILLLTSGILLGCNKNKDETLFETSTVKIELESFAEKHRVAIETKNIDGIMKFYSNDLITISPDEPILYGNEWIRELLIDIYKSYDFFEEFSFIDIQIMDSLVAASYIFMQKMTPLNDENTIVHKGKGMCILSKTEVDQWQFIWNTYHYDNLKTD